MKWKIAQAKARFSDVVRSAAREPQVILNRRKPVAAVIAAEELADYQTWRETRKKTTLAEHLKKLQRICEEEGYQFEPAPREPDRPNAFLKMLKKEERVATGRHKRRQ